MFQLVKNDALRPIVEDASGRRSSQRELAQAVAARKELEVTRHE